MFCRAQSKFTSSVLVGTSAVVELVGKDLKTFYNLSAVAISTILWKE